MKLFISWSGEFSRKVAERLSVWIPTIIQSVDVFYSPDDIAKGENWGNRLSEELEQSNFGIVCLTPENVSAPWIHFEAGALSKAANSRLSAIMLGINPSDVKGPLARFQNTAFERDDFFRLFQSINASSDKPLKPEILVNTFNISWEGLMSDIDAIIKEYSSRVPIPEKHEKANSDSDALQEILRLVRNLDNIRYSTVSSSPSASNASRQKLSADLDRDTVNILFYCPTKNIDCALPTLRKYIHPETEVQRIERVIKAKGAASFLNFPRNQLGALRAELPPGIEVVA